MKRDITLKEALEGIDDFRQENNVEHKLMDKLMLTILATICGANGHAHIQEYGIAKYEWLKGFMELPFGIPSAYTIRRVMMNINPKQFHEAFIKWVQIICEKVNGLVSIDGKTARRPKGLKDGKKALHVVSAFTAENKLILGQIATDEKSNEITAIPELLKMLELSGCIVTIDAMGTQKEIAATIVEKGADYVLSVKGNQRTLHDDIALYIETELIPADTDELTAQGAYYSTLDNEHGRLEKREYYVCDDISWLPQKDEWAGLAGFGLCIATVTTQQCVTVETDGEKTRRLVENTSVSRNYAIYSVENMTAEKFAEYKRGHWGIENSLRWSLDMSFREDESRARADHSAENLNIIRHLSHNLLKSETTARGGIATKRLKCGWDNDYLMKVIAKSMGVGF